MSVLLAAVLFLAPAAHAQVPAEYARPFSKERLGGALGLGIAIGSPAGLTGKLWISQDYAVQFSAGATLGVYKDLSGTVDFLYHMRPINVEGDDFAIPVFVGGGFKSDINFQIPGGVLLFGPRAIAGACLLLPDLPVEFHAEVAPAVYLVGDPGWVMDGQVGVRYYF